MRFDFGALSNTRQQGDVGVMAAALHFTARGDCVCFPATEGCRYDLIIDSGNDLSRVQVKTSRNNARFSDGWEVALCTSGGNRSGTGRRKVLDSAEFDLLFILAEDGRSWLIPAESVHGMGSIVVGGKKWGEYQLP